MILVDTSVVIDYTQGKDTKLVASLPTLPVVVCGVVRAELLHGARDPHYPMMQKVLPVLKLFVEPP